MQRQGYPSRSRNLELVADLVAQKAVQLPMAGDGGDAGHFRINVQSVISALPKRFATVVE